MVDAARLRVLLSRLRARRQELARYAQLPQDQYLADPQTVYASKYLVLTLIEDALGIANHVIASEGYRAPSDDSAVEQLDPVRSAGGAAKPLGGRAMRGIEA